MSEDCILCCEEIKYFGITECNHGPFCYRCIFKMRVINKNNSCPICKHKSNQIMISSQFTNFGQFKEEILPDSAFGDVFHCGKQAKKQFERLREYKCFLKVNGKPCKFDKSFQNIAFLKKHLKQQHKRVLCDICLQKKTCVLQQHKLYTQVQLNRHLQRGDTDDIGNVLFLHPFCGFCKIYFFDEDQFKRHVNLQHMTCNVCGAQHKYVYYKDYNSLETHYKISHYICSDMNCLAKKFIAFRSAQQLKIHRAEAHGTGNKKIDGKQLCGFNYGGIVTQQFIELKDKEGIDMQDQYLTLKRIRSVALGEADKQQDSVLDMRDFFPCQMEDEQHYHDSFILKHKNNNSQHKQVQQTKPANKKKKYIEKQQFQKQKPTYAKQNEQFTIQQLNLIKSHHQPKLHYEDFQDKLATLLSNDDLKKLEVSRNKFNKRQMSSHQFVQNFYSLMKKVSLRTGYQIFPHYLRTIQNQDAKLELQYEYIKSLKKIPMKVECMLSVSKTYGDLFKNLNKQIQINLKSRIRDKSLSIKKPIIRQKERLFQLMGVVRRLKIQQMSKFNFATNFGIVSDTIQLIRQKIFKMKQQNIQSRLSKIPNEEFINLYIFSKYCYQAITHNQNVHLSKNKIHQQVLQDFLFQNPELVNQFGPKKQQFKTLQEKVQFQKQQQQRNHKKKLKDIQKKNKDLGYHSNAKFSLSDKTDFPDLEPKKKVENQNKQQNFRDVIDHAKNKPATYQKKINQLFPSLGQEKSNQQGKEKEKKEGKVTEKKQKAWWQKINEPKFNQEQEKQQVVKIRKGKNKKQKWVSGNGFFN